MTRAAPRRHGWLLAVEWVALTICVAVLAVGVGLTAILWFGPGDQQAALDHVSLEAEWIPNARIDSQLPGRYVFRPGIDRVLVVSRVQSRLTLDAQIEPGFLDRLWVQIPAATQAMQRLDIQDLDATGYVGFDRGTNDKGVYAWRPDVTGHLAVLAMDDDQAVLRLDLNIRRDGKLYWPIQRVILAKVTQTGRVARPHNAYGDALWVKLESPRPIVPASDQIDPSRFIGRWFGQMRGYHNEVLFDLHFQIDDEGRFVYTSGRGSKRSNGGYSPGVKYGQYEFHQDWLILTVEKFVFDEPMDNNHLHWLGPVPMIALKYRWQGQTLVLSGDYRVSKGKQVGDVAFSQKEIPDLRQFRPNFDRNPGYYARSEPTVIYPNPRDGR